MRLLKKSPFTFFAVFFLFVSTAFCITKEEAYKARQDIISYAKQFIGVPYVKGGISSSGMDCSGFLFTISREATGIQLPRTVSAMYSDMRIVSLSQLEPGDALFFKTHGNKISHVGLYIGKNQFIHAVSDGPNTGVILSSLNQTTWNNSYAAVGQFLPPTKEFATMKETINNNNSTTKPVTESSFKEKLSFDAFASVLWNSTTSHGFMFNLRGADLETHLTYKRLKSTKLAPGFGIRYRFDPKMNIFQMPIIFSVTLHDTLRIYSGPIITFGSPAIIGNSKAIKASFFPGILGVAWHTPSWSLGSATMCFVQDVAWSVFNNLNNSALTPYESVCTGLSFSTGFRVTIPVSKLLN